MSEVKEKFTVSAIKKELIQLVWPVVEGFLQQAVDHSNGEMCIEDVFKRLIKGNMLLVTISVESDIVAAIAIEQRNFGSGKRVLNLTLLGGSEMEHWMDEFSDIADKLAKDYKCDEIYIVGRKGWVRALRSYGFETVHTVVSRKVGD